MVSGSRRRGGPVPIRRRHVPLHTRCTVEMREGVAQGRTEGATVPWRVRQGGLVMRSSTPASDGTVRPSLSLSAWLAAGAFFLAPRKTPPPQLGLVSETRLTGTGAGNRARTARRPRTLA